VAKLYKKGNAAAKAGVWGAFVIGAGTIVAIGIYEWVRKMAPVLILVSFAVALLLVCSGCMSRRTVEYYPDGSVQRETVEEGFTLGTQGAGEYNFLPVSVSAL
jgi:hypothetical protein